MGDKWDEIESRMEKLGIREADLKEKFVLGSGKGGQKLNKTSSCVYLKHLPTQVEVKSQRTRSRDLNRLYARRELCEEIENRISKEKSEKEQLREKIRRQKKRRSRKAQQKVLLGKKILSDKKNLRKPPFE